MASLLGHQGAAPLPCASRRRPPGCGKGTQSPAIKKDYCLCHLATGEQLYVKLCFPHVGGLHVVSNCLADLADFCVSIKAWHGWRAACSQAATNQSRPIPSLIPVHMLRAGDMLRAAVAAGTPLGLEVRFDHSLRTSGCRHTWMRLTQRPGQAAFARLQLAYHTRSSNEPMYESLMHRSASSCTPPRLPQHTERPGPTTIKCIQYPPGQEGHGQRCPR